MNEQVTIPSYRYEIGQAIVKNTSVCIVVISTEGKPLFLNPAAITTTGYTLDEVKDKTLHKAFHHTRIDGTPFPEEECKPAMYAKQALALRDYEDVFIRKDGTFYPVKINLIPLIKEDKFTFSILEFRDVSDEKGAKDNLLRSANVLKELVNAGQWLSEELDLQSLTQRITDAATRLSGADMGAFFFNIRSEQETFHLYALSGVSPETFKQFPMPRATAIFSPTLNEKQILRIGDVTKDSRYGHNKPHKGLPPGHAPVVSYLSVPVISRSGEVFGGLFLSHSKPNMFSQEAEDLVKALSAHAASAIDNARAFRNMTDALAARDEFLSIASHELRTPLTPLVLQLNYLGKLAEAETISKDQIKKVVEVSSRKVQRLVKLVNELLDVTRITIGKLELNPEIFDLAELVNDFVEQHTPEIIQGGGSILIEPPTTPTVGCWDKIRLEQVFVNLLTNATKHAPGKPIIVSLNSYNDKIKLSVKDFGPGIEPDRLNFVFKRFERGGVSKTAAGLGLGLYISKQIVDAHGGSIKVNNSPEGAEFVVELPRYITE